MSPTPRLGKKIAVVLGSGLLADGSPSEATRLRAQAAAELAASHPDLTLILSGCRAASDKGGHGTTEAKVMAAILKKHGIADKRILLEEDSRDTLGNAIFVAARFLAAVTPRTVYIVTSAFHIERALTVFKYVLGEAWSDVRGQACAKAWDDDMRGVGEADSIQRTMKFFAGIKSGDLTAMVKRAKEKHDLYADLAWLGSYVQPVIHRRKSRKRLSRKSLSTRKGASESE